MAKNRTRQEFEKKDVAKVVQEIQESRHECAQAVGRAKEEGELEKREFLREVQQLKSQAEKAVRRCKDAVEGQAKERRRAKRKEEALKELHDEINEVKEAKRAVEASKLAMESEHKREVRDMQRRADLGGARASSGRLAGAGGSETAKTLREAFQKENEVLRELANMSESLSRQGWSN
jgi:hypothetical protein